ncbi:DEAD/DEAH-box helicase (macronuclear) [Tetrahymena thermophila SB210]|uniref:RNA helicase n=1 Tax=Tetrahymena thermophila (strain SB210) TaxID=312017 RepID=I7MFU6_TETTS|nr:DEAD/DEAH-box helicase [Tetrahymena thermophila SB210]EAS00609.2 DEAD/DEAH-box helicase [Tetrahymena thermophila SB210]|eukprot:XP_001020854.2 DEAD/DEAH-box helicase [Tetrahymena thermophila SB210]
MGKKLTAQQKLQKLQEKKKKDAERKEILLGLQKGVQDQKQIIEKMTSIKDMGLQNKIEKKLEKERKHKKSLEMKKETDDSKLSEEEEVEDFEPDVEKKQKVEEDDAQNKQKQAQQPSVNIFAQAEYINPNKDEEEEERLQKEYEQKLQKQREIANSQIQLENQVKKLIPDLNFDTFDGAKTSKRVLEDLSTTDEMRKEKQRLEEEYYKEPEYDDFIEDELLKPILQGQKKVFNTINRSDEQDKARKKLPIFMREADILDAVENNLITILCGETGSGKSTQTVQFLYEAGYTNKAGPNPGMIGITQPRRIAAIALAKRVSDEMNMTLGKEIVYQVRHEHSTFNEDSAIKFMTDGILMNEMCSDFLLSKYSVIMIDEAHERKINTDLLLGLLSRLVNIRARLALEERKNAPQDQTKFKYYPLRVIIMSATLRVEDFTQNKYLLPKKINVINVEARQFPVNTYFSKRTPNDYLQAAVKKCCQIHSELPPGDVLVFLTGEREIKEFCITLEQQLNKKKREIDLGKHEQKEYTEKDFLLDDSDDEDGKEKMDEEQDEQDEVQKKLDELENQESKNQNSIFSQKKKLRFEEDQDHENQEFLKAADEEEEKNRGIIQHNPMESENLKAQKKTFLHFKILPLFSKLPLQEQEKIFKNKSPNTRLIIASTNVAETSLTIPNIKYVVDCGREKKKIYSTKASISKHVIKWISQASCDQRQGRAGRTGPGYCYRLFAPSVYANIFEKFSDPEILSMPLESVILHLKAIGIQDVIKFPYPTPPSLLNMKRALQNLVKIKALRDKNMDVDQEIEETNINEDDRIDKSEITELGKILAFLPINPRFSKMLLQGRAGGVTTYALILVTALTIEELFCRGDFRIEENPADKLKDDYLKENDELYASDEDSKMNAKDILKQKLNMIQEQKELKKKLVEKRREEIARFKEYFEKFMIGKSDLFIHMNIIGEFIEKIYKDNPSTSKIEDYIYEYAKERHLHPKGMKEVYYNLNQISDILESIIDDPEEKKQISQGFQPYVKPNATQQKLLQEIVISCFIDQCARKVFYLDEENRKKVAYECLETTERVFINSTSFLIKNQPDFIVYTDIMETKKKYMNNITIVEDVSLLYKYDYRTTNRKLQYVYEPKPFYSKKKNQLVILGKSTFGKRKWDLPTFETTFQEESIEKYCWFARCLLEGQVLDFFKACKSLYQFDPQIIKSSNLQPKVQAIVNKLKNNQIDNSQKLVKKWESDKSFLLPEVALWIKDQYKANIQKKWPPTS